MRSLASCAALLAALAVIAPTEARGALPPPLSEVGVEQRLAESIPLQLPLTDERGRTLPLAAYFSDRPVILVPAYYRCPQLCGQVLGGLAGALKAISLQVGRDYQVIAVSFDPTDTPAEAAVRKADVVRRYHRPGSESGWHFLTGAEPTVRALMQAIGYRYAYDARSQQYAHAAAAVILTPEGRISSYLLGIEPAPRDLRLGLVEASAGKIGSPIDRLLLFCYRYDPTSGRYGARIVSAMRVGGLLTLTALFLLIAMLLIRDRSAP